MAADGPDLLHGRRRLVQSQGGQVKLVAGVCLQLLVQLLFSLLQHDTTWFETTSQQHVEQAGAVCSSHLQETEGALDEAALCVLLLAELHLQDGLLLLQQAEGLSRGGEEQLGVGTEANVWNTQIKQRLSVAAFPS